jgi:hypothetical protein
MNVFSGQGTYGVGADVATATEDILFVATDGRHWRFTAWTFDYDAVSGPSFEMPARDVVATANWQMLPNLIVQTPEGEADSDNPLAPQTPVYPELPELPGHEYEWQVVGPQGPTGYEPPVYMPDNDLSVRPVRVLFDVTTQHYALEFAIIMPAANVTATANWTPWPRLTVENGKGTFTMPEVDVTIADIDAGGQLGWEFVGWSFIHTDRDNNRASYSFEPDGYWFSESNSLKILLPYAQCSTRAVLVADAFGLSELEASLAAAFEAIAASMGSPCCSPCTRRL